MTRILLSLAALLLAAPAWADDGKALFAAKGCVACHGEAGAKPIPGSPNLAGQNAVYLLRQMDEIVSGVRSSPPLKPMKPVIDKTTPDERKALAGWLAAQKPAESASGGDKAKMEKGAELFDELGCIGCHGADALKPLADYPVLAGQRKDYLTTQIKAIRDEVRSTRRARMMTANVRKLNEAQIDQITEFISNVKRK